MSSLDNLRKAARRWLKALRANDPDAHARLTRAMPGAPSQPVLRDVQHALAREHGHENWLDLTRAVTVRDETASPDIEQFERLAETFLHAYRTGDPASLRHLGKIFDRNVTPEQLHAEVRRRLAQLPEAEQPTGDLTLTDVRRFLAREAWFDTWEELVNTLSGNYTPSTRATRPPIPRDDADRASGMLRPVELRISLPMELRGGEYSTTDRVWQMLAASRRGDAEAVATLLAAAPSLARCEYNYMPPLHLAVREGHVNVVRLLLDHRAYAAEYKTYPYGESLLTMADDRPDADVRELLREHAGRPRAPLAEGRQVHGLGHIEFPADEDRDGSKSW
jgi:hypothetical protein